ncbi:type IV secretory system conjugative DNA transfer family protein [Hyphomicrobium sp. CS1BSMeth3]|uniref:type IV secretory system conjugative DNA transfer family protein n=1 Tax=Hyphomicrobium sp. CS1BSMeth3 TaxID=1892844 RepID=UPI000930811A|nr:type IV secretory system conjugative DNA transfer family protein [Hyphomicrobium sp. CS1BSMeth3]
MTISPIFDLGNYTTATLVPAVEALAADKSAALCIPVAPLLATLSDNYFEACLLQNDERIVNPQKAMLEGVQAAGAYLAGGAGLALAGAVAKNLFSRAQSSRRRSQLTTLMRSAITTRAIASLDEPSCAILIGHARLAAQHAITPEEWHTFLANLAFHNASPTSTVITLAAEHQTHPLATQVQRFLSSNLTLALPPYNRILADGAARMMKAPDVRPLLERGSRWLAADDLAASPTFKAEASKRSLILGTIGPAKAPVYFDGTQSLITIGRPGKGKSQAHIVTNLLNYAGSAFVLDPSGELWQMTAGYRQKHFGPVYRFSPTDPQGRTHRFNPFDFIARTPNQAADDCTVLSHQLIAENPNSHDKFWDSAARDIIWAFALAIALRGTPGKRTITALNQLIGLPFPADDPRKQAFLATASGHFLLLLDAIAQNHNIPEVASVATRIRTGMQAEGKMLDSVFANARNALSLFGRSEVLRNATAHSDWTPAQLRQRPGSTVYLCIREDELTALAPLVRLIFQTHIKVLSRLKPSAGEPPITFFMDEMPRLGHFDAMLNMQDTGRKHGLRLWMLAQNVGQIIDAYGKQRGEGLIETCHVRMFMAPDQAAYDLVKPTLGETRDIITGETRPLVSLNDLAGRRYADQTLTITDGEHPAMLDKILGDKVYSNRFMPPPSVPMASKPTAQPKPTPGATT